MNASHHDDAAEINQPRWRIYPKRRDKRAPIARMGARWIVRDHNGFELGAVVTIGTTSKQDLAWHLHRHSSGASAVRIYQGVGNIRHGTDQ